MKTNCFIFTLPQLGKILDFNKILDFWELKENSFTFHNGIFQRN